MGRNNPNLIIDVRCMASSIFALDKGYTKLCHKHYETFLNK